MISKERFSKEKQLVRFFPREVRDLFEPYADKLAGFFAWKPGSREEKGVFDYQKTAARKIGQLVEENPYSLGVIFGPMMAGKSTVAIELGENLPGTKIFKHQLDTQRHGGARIVNHPATLGKEAEVYSSAGDLERWQRYSHPLIIDEIQFALGEEETRAVGFWIEQRKRYGATILAGLDTNFKREPWPIIRPLLQQADWVVLIEPKCGVASCNNIGFFTQRIIKDKEKETIRPASLPDPLVKVGGVDSYEPRCPFHHAVDGQDRWRPVEGFGLAGVWERTSGLG